MPFPLEPMPTVRQFIDQAVEGGCRERYHEFVSSTGKVVRGRHLISANGVFHYPMPLDESERLAPMLMASIARVTGTRAYAHLYEHLL